MEALRSQRPGAVGHVYNVYGPELVEYAETLLGEHDRALDAVREALLALRDEGAAVPDAGTFRDWLFEFVHDHCQGPPAKGRRRAVSIGLATGVVLTAGMLALFEATGGADRPAPPVAATTPATRTASPEPSKSSAKKDKPHRPVRVTETKRRPHPRGRLSIAGGGCHGVRAAGPPQTCPIRLTAVGGPVRWSVASVRSSGGRISASGGGTLPAGRSTTITVTVRSTVMCYMSGGGTGSVSFSPGGTATVSYTCWRR